MTVKATNIAEKETPASNEDRELGTRVIRNLKSNAVGDLPAQIQVWVEAGVVHLYGQVLMQAEKQLQEEIVRFTNGVRSVQNHLEILPCAGKKLL